jgi:hypothetical protein
VDERIDPLMTVQTEFEEWCQAGCEKAEDIISKSVTEEK